MFFDLTPQQRLLQDTVRQYFTSRFPLRTVRAAADGDDTHRERLWRDLAGLGATGILVPEHFGGSGLDVLDAALLAEQLGFAAAPADVLEHLLASYAIALGGEEEQQSRYLPALAVGSLRATIAFAEDRDCWHPDSWKLTQAHGGLSGRKRFVVGAGQADLIVVGTQDGLAIVEAGARGLTLREVAGVDPTRRLYAADFENVPNQALPRGRVSAAAVYAAGLIFLAADAFGGAHRCIDMASDYVKVRQQFGVTIAHFQAVKHQLASAAVDVVPAKPLYWYAAYLLSRGDPDATRYAALTKSHLADRYLQTSRRAIELHGGIGYTWEADTHLFARRALFDYAYFAAPAALRTRIARANGWLPDRTAETIEPRR